MQGLTNYVSIILGIIGGFSRTNIIGNNRTPNWHNFGENDGSTKWE